MRELDVIVPVWGRPELLRPMARSLVDTTPETVHLTLVISPNDPAGLTPASVVSAAGCGRAILTDWEGGTRGDYARKINLAYEHGDSPILFLGATDLIFHPNWYGAAKKRLVGTIQVVGTNDGGNVRTATGRHSTHTLVTRAYVEEHGTIDEPGKVLHEGYWHEYCNPPDAPIWMADLTFRHLGDVRVGDEVVGWERVAAGSTTLRALRRSAVRAIGERHAPLVRVVMESGRSFVCTPDHRWLNAAWSPSSSHSAEFVPAATGRSLLHVIDDPGSIPDGLARAAGYLAGIYDGEGSGIQIAQCPDANPVVSSAIETALNKVGIAHTRSGMFFTLTGGRQGYVDFLNLVAPEKRESLVDWVYGRGRTPAARASGARGGRFGVRDRVVAVEAAGEGTVVSMTTSTGNYVAQGYASRNCDDEFVRTARYRGMYDHARGSFVEHMHPNWGKRKADETDAREPERMAQGLALFESRRHLWGEPHGRRGRGAPQNYGRPRRVGRAR